MNSPWAALTILFAARLSMAFQYQVVAALGPLFMQRHGANLADLGVLISLYLLPGLVFAIPGGGIAQRFGDRRIVIAGLTIMIAGGAIMWLGETWTLQIIGRLLAGIGGAILNVVMSKMVADWFATGKIATAMAIYVNSWPMGIALALLVLPWVANIGGLSIALGLSAAFCAGGLALMTTLYRNPPKPVTQMPKGSWPKGSALTGVLLAGSVWGFYNGALAMVFVFGPPLLIARGASLTEASGISSLVLWIAVFSIPIGGLLADRLGRADAILLAGLAAFAATFAFALAQTGLPPFILMGLCCGLSAGPIMALPARVLRPETRALGMGIFFSLYYLWMSLLPALAGTVAETIGGVESAFVLGIAMLGLAAIGVLILRMPRFIAT